MVNNDKLSVIIPSYKPQGYIWECLDSLVKQTIDYNQFEIIIILNGCNEPYYSQISDYITNNMVGMNVRLIQTDEAGVSNARNIGLDNAKGEYITFIDDDDFVSPSYLEELYQTSKTCSLPIANILCFNDQKPYVFKKIRISTIYENLRNRNNIKIMDIRPYMSCPVAKLILKSDIIGTRRFNTKISNTEDALFMLEISDKISSIETTSNNAIYFIRYRDGSLTSSKRKFKTNFTRFNVLLLNYLKCLAQPWRYNPFFVLTRLVALIIY